MQGAPDNITTNARIAPLDEPGEPLRLTGQVQDAAARPVSGVIVYAYQTNQKGVYSVDENTKRLRLRGWSMTDADGKYAFETIRPGGYPNRPDPAHIHMHVVERSGCTYYIDDVVFSDDPRVASDKSRATKLPRGGSGLTHPVHGATGAWQANRDIYLGRNVPGYELCASESQHH
jgi:protocatechuate 3,4-dioxygenase beta subunit